MKINSYKALIKELTEVTKDLFATNKLSRKRYKGIMGVLDIYEKAASYEDDLDVSASDMASLLRMGGVEWNEFETVFNKYNVKP